VFCEKYHYSQTKVDQLAAKRQEFVLKGLRVTVVTTPDRPNKQSVDTWGLDLAFKAWSSILN
jgi:hypothetical protein